MVLSKESPLQKNGVVGLRVLHLVRSLRIGGLEKVVVDLTQGLARHGITSFLACLLDAGEWQAQAQTKDTWTGHLPETGVIRTFAGLCRYIRRQRIDLIHTHNAHPHKYGAPASVLTGRPLVHTKHGRNWPDNPRWVWFSRQLSRFTRFVVPVSRDIERIVTDVERVPARKVVTIFNGVDVERFGRTISGHEDLREENDKTIFRPGSVEKLRRGKQERFRETQLGASPGTLVVGSVGRFSSEKQYPALVRAFARFHDECPESLLVLVGDGPDREAIEAAVTSCGVTQCATLAGMQSNISEWLQCMNVFCLSSDQEGTSITLLEAGAAQLPAVVTDVGGNGEIVVEGETGFVVPFGDEGALAGAFKQLANDADLRRRMGAAARRRVEKQYSVDAMVAQYVELYRRALGGKPD